MLGPCILESVLCGTAKTFTALLVHLPVCSVVPRGACVRLSSERLQCNSKRAYSITPADAADEIYVGAYTPITKKLWTDRASKRSTAAQLQPAGVSRPSKLISVTYSFCTDRALQDMVGSLLLLSINTWPPLHGHLAILPCMMN